MLLAVLVTLYTGTLIGLASWRVAPAALGAAILWLLIIDRMNDVAQSTMLADPKAVGAPELHWIDVAGLPIAFVLIAGYAVGRPISPVVVYGIAAGSFLAFLFRRAVGAPRDAASLACMAVMTLFVMELPLAMGPARVVAFLLLVLSALALHKARPSISWLIGGAIVLAVAMVITIRALTERPARRIVDRSGTARTDPGSCEHSRPATYRGPPA